MTSLLVPYGTIARLVAMYAVHMVFLVSFPPEVLRAITITAYTTTPILLDLGVGEGHVPPLSITHELVREALLIRKKCAEALVSTVRWMKELLDVREVHRQLLLLFTEGISTIETQVLIIPRDLSE